MQIKHQILEYIICSINICEADKGKKKAKRGPINELLWFPKVYTAHLCDTVNFRVQTGLDLAAAYMYTQVFYGLALSPLSEYDLIDNTILVHSFKKSLIAVVLKLFAFRALNTLKNH